MCPCLLIHGGDHAELTANPENPASVNSRMAPSTHSHTVTKLVNDDVLISFDDATQLPKPEDSSLAQLRWPNVLKHECVVHCGRFEVWVGDVDRTYIELHAACCAISFAWPDQEMLCPPHACSQRSELIMPLLTHGQQSPCKTNRCLTIRSHRRPWADATSTTATLTMLLKACIISYGVLHPEQPQQAQQLPWQCCSKYA